MVWARFDDGYLNNLKVQSAGALAEHLDMRAIIYCAQNSTDGLVTPLALQIIGVGLPGVQKRVLALIAAGRWVPNEGGGWLIHDFLDFNPSKAQLDDKRTKTKERQAEYRARNSVTNSATNASPRSGRDISSLETEKNAEIAKPTWMRLGMSRDEWMAAGRPEAS